MPVKQAASIILLVIFAAAAQAETTVELAAQPAALAENPGEAAAPRDEEARPAAEAAPPAGSETPIETHPAQVGAVSEDLWERVRIGFAIAELDSPLIREHEAWYASRPDYVQRMVERSQRYLYHIVEEVEKRGMPSEIALLPMIESAYNPKAYSRSHASGIWQFIPSTGKDFGLEQNYWYDGRRDILAATDAALDYLQKLYDMFGSWELALAAYNWGEGSVSRAIARNAAKGLATDYLSLTMPAETRNYVPKLIAVKHIVSNPAAFGLILAPIPNRPYFTAVTTTKQMDVAIAARLAGVPLDEFEALNPAHKRPVMASASKTTVLLPQGKADTFTQNLLNYAKPLVSWQTYTTRIGEKLSKIASKFGIPLAKLKEINSIPPQRTKLSTPQTLLVPLSENAREPAPLAVNAREAPPEPFPRSTGYAIRKGDTLFSIARRFNVAPAQLKAWNNLKSDRIAPGQKLAIRGETAPAPTRLAKVAVPGKRTQYTVQRGDSLSSIARRFNVAVDDIQHWNSLPARHALYPGSKLTVFLPRKG